MKVSTDNMIKANVYVGNGNSRVEYIDRNLITSSRAGARKIRYISLDGYKYVLLNERDLVLDIDDMVKLSPTAPSDLPVLCPIHKYIELMRSAESLVLDNISNANIIVNLPSKAPANKLSSGGGMASRIYKNMGVSIKHNPNGIKMIYAAYTRSNGVSPANATTAYCDVRMNMYGGKDDTSNGSSRGRICRSAVQVWYIDHEAFVSRNYICELVKAARADIGYLDSSKSLRLIYRAYNSELESMSEHFPNDSGDGSHPRIRLVKHHLVLLKSVVKRLRNDDVIIDYKLCKLMYKTAKSGLLLTQALEDMTIVVT